MVATPVSLQEVLSAIGGPLEEQSLWALLYQTSKSLKKALQGKRMRRYTKMEVYTPCMQVENGQSC